MSIDTVFMARALQLAKKGLGTVAPNPLVGAVLVKEGRVIGEGFHKKKGTPHAEPLAIDSSCVPVEGATLYCTLEPCCHTNKTTPPCTEKIIKSLIKKVVIACLDPNPEVAGKGVEALRTAGIEVVTGVLEEEAKDLNKIFFKNMNASIPFVHLKLAMTLDGRMASTTGSSMWITSEYARKEVHALRRAYDAVLIGSETLRKDNPDLNSRSNEKVVKRTLKIIIGDLEDLERFQIFKDPENKIINIYNNKKSDHNQLTSFKNKGSWKENLKELFKYGVNSILVEGGSKVASSVISEDSYDLATFYLSPKIIGNGPSIFESSKNTAMENATKLRGSWRITQGNEAVYEVTK